MDSLDIRNLYAAYRSVYEDQQSLTEEVDVELDEETKGESHMLKGAEGMSASDRANVLHQVRRANRANKDEKTDRQRVLSHKLSSQKDRNERRGYDEEVDVYDLVLDHLLDEGFCDDVESAEVVMANMSEEWLDEILDEAVEIMSVTSPEGKLRKGTRIRPPQTENRRTFRRLAALQKRQRENPKAISARSAREQSAREVEKNTKKSLKNLNSDPNVEVKHGYEDTDRAGYRSVPTDYRARKRRASGR
jgi:hypothetical protein